MRGFILLVISTLILCWGITGYAMSLDDQHWLLDIDRINVVALTHVFFYVYTVPTMIVENRTLKESLFHRRLRLPYHDPKELQEMIYLKAIGAVLIAAITLI